MTINSVRFLGYRKAGRCDHCRRRVGSTGKAVVVRLAAPDPIHGVMGVGICFECIGEWAAALKTPAPRRWTGGTSKAKKGNGKARAKSRSCVYRLLNAKNFQQRRAKREKPKKGKEGLG